MRVAHLGRRQFPGLRHADGGRLHGHHVAGLLLGGDGLQCEADLRLRRAVADPPRGLGAGKMTCEVAPSKTVSMLTRDGVRLDADVYHPTGRGPVPVLLMPQPSGRQIAVTVVYAPPDWAADGAGLAALRAAARTLPLNEERTAWPAVLQRYSAYTHYADWIGNPVPAGYWDRISPAAALAGRTGDVPLLHVGGWYDPMLDGTLGAFRAMTASRGPQRLIVGPLGHIPRGRRAGILDC